MQRHPANTGHLDDLHKEIDYFDRKIAYCRDLEQFDSDIARASALQKLITKRASMAKAAAEITAMGVPFNPRYLPRSFRKAAAEADLKSAL